MSSEQDIKQTLKSQGAIITLSIRENALKAFIEIQKDNQIVNNDDKIINNNFDQLEKDLCDWIESFIPSKMIDAKVLKSALTLYKTTGCAKERKIAQGIPPKSGANGKTILLIKPFSSSFEGVYSLSDRFQKHFDVITKDAVVARIYKPKAGSDGLNIYNKAVPSPAGLPVVLTLNEQLAIKTNEGQNYDEIIALENGYISHQSQPEKNSTNLSLETILKFAKGIDHKTGSIFFPNSIQIIGDVKDGFKVEATKDILISGNVTHSSIISQTGSIEVSGIILDDDISEEGFTTYLKSNAPNQHTVSASKQFKAKALQNARVFSGDVIEISGPIVRSHVYSSSIVTCKSSVYASKISTACGVEAKTFGNESGVLTIIEFLHPIEAGLEYITKKQIIERHLERKQKLEVFIGPFLKDQNSLIRLSSDHKMKVRTALNEVQSLIEVITKQEQELKLLKESAKEIKTSQLNCLEMCHTNVNIIAAENTYNFIDEKKGQFSLFYNWENKSFTIEKYKPIACELS